MNNIYKVEAQGDVLYFQAGDLAHAKEAFREMMGEVPESLLTWTQIDKLPDGEVFANA